MLVVFLPVLVRTRLHPRGSRAPTLADSVVVARCCLTHPDYIYLPYGCEMRRPRVDSGGVYR